MSKIISLENLQSALIKEKVKIDNKYGGLIDRVDTLDTSVASLNTRSIINEVLDYGYFSLSTTPNTSTNFIVPFDTVNEKLNININNGYISLKKGRTYKISVVLCTDTTTSYTNYAIFERSKDVQISGVGRSVSVNYDSNISNSGLECVYTAKDNCEIFVKILSPTSQRINNQSSSFIIQEIGRATIIDPIAARDNYIVEYGSYSNLNSTNITISTKQDNLLKYLQKTDGNISINNDYTVTLKKGKTYSIECSALFTVADISLEIIDLNGIIYAKGYSGSTGGWSDVPARTVVTPIEDIKIYLQVRAIRTAATSIGDTSISYTSFIIQEISQPVVVEYNNYKEISNPLTSGGVSQETPVGTMISYMGNVTPEHYLNMDGSIYNITDYPLLAEHFLNTFGRYNYYGGDGITTFAVPNKRTPDVIISAFPTMTSNTTPTPYIASASSEYNESYQAWELFSGRAIYASDGWASISNIGWVQIKLDSAKKINRFKVTAPNRTDTATTMPKDFSLQGSNDGITFKTIKTITNQINWTAVETRIYDLDSTVNYQYYRINITANNGSAMVIIAYINLDLVIPNTSLNCIKYESTYTPINQYGGFESNVLFEGNISNTGTYDLTDSIENYDFFLVTMKATKYELGSETNVEPTLTSNNTPAPYVVSASSEYAGGWNSPYRSFDNDTASGWATASGSPTGWIQLDFNTSKTISAFAITAVNNGTYYRNASPKDFTLQGSNDGVTFTDIKSFTNQINWTIAERRTYSLDTPFSYRYYRINITANNGADIIFIGELEFIYQPTAATLVIQKNEMIKAVDPTDNIVLKAITTDELCSSKIEVSFPTNTTFVVSNVSNTGFAQYGLTRIVGVKGALPTLLTGGEF